MGVGKGTKAAEEIGTEFGLSSSCCICRGMEGGGGGS